MRWIRDHSGRLPLRPHFEAGEIDRECEGLLRSLPGRRPGAPVYPLTTDDLTVLVEAVTDDLDLYADLGAEAPDAEGVTDFFPGRRPRVRIARALSESARREHRLRTTLAHELGHVQLHACLWTLDAPGGRAAAAARAAGARASSARRRRTGWSGRPATPAAPCSCRPAPSPGSWRRSSLPPVCRTRCTPPAPWPERSCAAWPAHSTSPGRGGDAPVEAGLPAPGRERPPRRAGPGGLRTPGAHAGLLRGRAGGRSSVSWRTARGTWPGSSPTPASATCAPCRSLAAFQGRPEIAGYDVAGRP